MRIALDAMGTDTAPLSEIEGAVQALAKSESDLEIVLVGDQAVLEGELSKHSDFPLDRLSIVHAPDRIVPGESPAQAVRKKPRSSIVVGVKLQKDGAADAFVSGGSTGAVMAASLLFLRPLQGVDRPAIGTVLPTSAKPTLLLDAGANVDCKPQHLVQFSHLGRIYAQDLLGVKNPRIGLLNIGEEPEKGNELSVEAHRLLAAEDLNFIGNIEGREIIRGGSDVVVCDGFAGNLILKFYESVAEFIMGLLKRELEVQHVETLDLRRIFRSLDYTEYGGAPLLGVNGVIIITHGSAPPKAISSAVNAAAQAVRSSMVTHMASALAKQDVH
ncbi:MAG: phosphate acyltransferase PlsX [Gemmatimonadota bacterium]